MKYFRFLFLLAFSACVTAQADEPVFDIPKLDGVTIDGKGSDWVDKGFSVETLAGELGEVRSPQDLDVKFRLGWDDQGLLVLASVSDDQVAGTDDPQSFSEKDSVEMFLGGKPGGRQYFQVTAGAGVKSGTSETRNLIVDRRKPAPPQKLEAESVSTRTADGYVVEARLPWSNLAITPVVGEEVTFQLCVNDVDGTGPRFAVTWYPKNRAAYDPKAMCRLRLAEKAASPVRMVARASMEQGKACVNVVAPALLAGQQLTASVKGKTVATGVFDLFMGRACATFVLPSADVVGISNPEAGSVTVDFNGVREAISKAISDAQIVFKPCVFSGEKFPPCDFEQRAEVEKWLGNCTITPVFYDADYKEVKTAAKPGRYGAVVQVKIARGQTFKRFITLYRTSKELNWRTAKIGVQAVTFSPELGIEPAVSPEDTKCVGAFFRDQFRAGVNRGDSAAVLFAGLSERKGGDTTADAGRNNPDALNRKWWFGLKKQIGELRTDYYVHLPAGYDKDPKTKWPLMLFLHGIGERGYNVTDVQRIGLPSILGDKPDFPFIVVAPQCSPGEWWSSPELNDLLDRVEAKYRVDVERVYLTGLSMGGFGSWALAADSPQRFAALVPICGGGDPDDAPRLKNLPIWVFHGGKDPIVPIQRSQEMVDALKKEGGNVQFTVFPEAKHDSWSQAYAMPELYEWLLKQRRGKAER